MSQKVPSKTGNPLRKRRSSVTGDASARALHFAFMQGVAGAQNRGFEVKFGKSEDEIR